MPTWIKGNESDNYVSQLAPEATRDMHASASTGRQLMLRKCVTRVISEIEERNERSGPFKKKIVQRFNAVKTVDIEDWTVFDGLGKPVIIGHPSAADSDNKSVWLAVQPSQQIVNGSMQTVYSVHHAKYWLDLRRPPTGRDLDADEVDREMRKVKVQDNQERKHFEKFVIDKVEDEPVPKPKRKKTTKSDDPVSSINFQAPRDEDGEWEGEQEFSDDDELLADDDDNQKDELGLDVDADDAEKTKEPVDDEDETVQDKFGDDITRILQNEQEKEKNANDENLLDLELEQMGSDDDDDAPVESGESSPVQFNVAAPPTRPVQPRRAPLSKEDEMRARVKDLFWRNEFSLSTDDIRNSIPIPKGHVDYKLLVDSLRELAEVRGGRLYLRQQFRV